MSVTLLRKESDVSNIQNHDDIRAFRYATCGINGVIKGRLNECDYDISEQGNFKIKSGEIIIDGWQVKVDANGIALPLNSFSDTQYYSVYCEINLSITDNKIADIKMIPDSMSYPVIDKGDDISLNDHGVARLLLYTFETEGQLIKNVNREFEYIDGSVKIAQYASEDISKGTIEERLTRLGFSEGSINDANGVPVNATQNKLRKMGNFVLSDLDISKTIYLLQDGNTNFYSGELFVGTLSKGFYPKEKIIVDASGGYSSSNPLRTLGISFIIDIDGKCFFDAGGFNVSSQIVTGTFNKKNFGYEAQFL